MKKQTLDKVLKRGVSLLVALVVSVSSFVMDIGAISLQAAMRAQEGPAQHTLTNWNESEAKTQNYYQKEKIFGLDGHNFEIPLALTKEEVNFISYAEAVAYRYSDFNKWDIVDMMLVDADATIERIQREGPGEYNVQFRPIDASELTLEVTATVRDERLTISAQDVSMSMDEANATNHADMLERIGASATTKNKIYEKKEKVVDKTGALKRVYYEEKQAEINSLTISDEDIDALRAIKDGQSALIPITIKAQDTAGDYQEAHANVLVSAMEDLSVKAEDVLDNNEFASEKYVKYRKNKTNLTEAQFLADSKVVADDHYKITTDFNNKVKIGTLGVYPVTITRTDIATDTVEKLIIPVLVINDDIVINEETEAMMHASRRITKQIQLENMKNENWVERFNVQAWNLQTGESLRVRLRGQVPLEYGLHTITFEALNKNNESVLEKQADVYVSPRNETPDGPAPFFVVNGVDFELPIELAKNPDNFINYGRIAAYRYDDPEDWTIRTIIEAQLVDTEATIKKIQEQGTGDYVIMFMPDGSKTMKVPRTVSVTDSKVSLETRDVVMSVADVAMTNATDIINQAVKRVQSANKRYEKKLVDFEEIGIWDVVYDETDATIEAITISDEDIDAVKAINKGQTEPLTITITAQDNVGDFTTKQVNVYVHDEVNNETNQAINAHNFAIKRSDINHEAYEAQFITLAHATMYDFNEVPPVMSNALQVVINQQIFSTVGDYTVTFRTLDGKMSKDVIVHIYEDVNEKQAEAMNANDFAIGLSDLPFDDNALNEKLITLAEAKGYDISSVPSAKPTEIEVKVSTPRPTTRGEYDVTFETITGKTKLQVKMYVYDVVNYKEERAMNANDFTMPWQLMQKATEERLIALAEVKAYDITGIKEQPPVIAAEQIMLKSTRPTQVGAHDVTFGIVDKLAKPNSVHETEITVKANVIDTNITLDADDALALSLADAQNIDATKLKQEAHVQASTANKHDDGTDAIITEEDITVIAGLDELRSLDTAPDPEDPITVVIQAKDSVRDKTTRDIEVYVYDAVNEDRTYGMNARSFALKLSEARS